MVDGRTRNDWARQAAFMALLANCHRDPKKSAYKPDDFNPTVNHGHARGTPLRAGGLSKLAKRLGAKEVTVKASDVRVVPSRIAKAAHQRPGQNAKRHREAAQGAKSSK